MSETSLLTRLHREIRGNYKTQWSADTEESCKRVLRDLIAEIGPERTKTAVHACIDSEEFFSGAALRRHIPRLASSEPDYCDRCRESSGFLLVKAENEIWATKCHHDGVTDQTITVGRWDSLRRVPGVVL